MDGKRSALLWLIDALIFLNSQKRLVFSLGLGVVVLMVGIATCRHVQKAGRTKAWMSAEFSPLGKSIGEILSHEKDSLAPKVPGAIAYQVIQKIDRHGAKVLSEPEARFHAIYQLCAGARVSGFEVYFGSADGAEARTARDGFVEIGAVRTAAIVERAMAVFPDGEVPGDRSRRQKLILQTAPAARPVWQQCDEQIRKADEPLAQLLVEYVKKRESEFVFR
jgi:hypothetical protein